MRFDGVDAGSAKFLWQASTPSRLRFFCRLLTLARIHTRDVLLHKTIISVHEASCLCCCEALETANHLFFGCHFATAFWRSVEVDIVGASVDTVHQIDVSAAVRDVSPDAFVMLCCWHL